MARPNSFNSFGVKISYHHGTRSISSLHSIPLGPCLFFPFSHLSSSPFLISPLPRFLLTPFLPPLEGTGALASLMAGADVGVCAGTNKTPAWEPTGSSHLPRLMALGCPLAPSEPAEEPLMLCCLRRRPRRNGAPFSPRCFSPDLLLNFVLVRGRVFRSTRVYSSVNV